MIELRGSNGAVVAADSFAAQAGAEILKRGGNAIDAVVAAVLVECVVQPHNVGLGGYAGTAVIYLADRKETVAVDFDSLAPLAAASDMFASAFCHGGWLPELHDSAYPGRPNRKGYLCVTAPPVVAGLSFLLDHFGTLPFSEVAEAAQRFAGEGFPVYHGLEWALALFAERADRSSLEAFLPDGRAPREGETFRQADLARLIERLRQDGPRSFYEGEIPRTIVETIRGNGGILQDEDFARVKPSFQQPLSVRCGGRTVFTPPPPSGGLTALQILKLVDRMGLSVADLGSAAYYRALIECARHAWSDRYEYLGDPLFVDVPVERLLSDEYADEVSGRVRAGMAPRPVEPDLAGAEHTVHLVAADKDRNVVSITCTHGSTFGAMLAVPGLGLVFGNGMSRFDPVPGRANSVAPGKRMLHNMSPLIITDGERPRCAIGLPGGRKIVNVASLLAHGVASFGLSCGQVIDLPRFHVEGPGHALVDAPAIAAGIRSEFGDDYPVSISESRLGGPVAGLMLSEDESGFLAASDHGPSCVAVV